MKEELLPKNVSPDRLMGDANTMEAGEAARKEQATALGLSEDATWDEIQTELDKEEKTPKRNNFSAGGPKNTLPIGI